MRGSRGGRRGPAEMRGTPVVVPARPVVWEVRGDLDLVGAMALREATTLLPERGRTLYVDLDGVHFMDCSGIGALVDLTWRASQRGVEVVITGVRRQALRVIAVTGAHRELLVATAPSGGAGEVDQGGDRRR